ncbi:MAG: inositol monophosphatase [Acidimicrobiales bacterium]|nr:inositol monophosphatase [Acidimicrobiales bacterium]
MAAPVEVAPAELLALARPLAEACGARLLAGLADQRTIDTKSTMTDVVTEMDTWAESFLTAGILAARPDDSVQGEEGADQVGTSGVRWWLDPIDGTVNYVHGMPGWNVSVAAEVGGEIVAGVVVSPMHGDVFSAAKGGGAHNHDRPISVSACRELGRAVVGTGFGYDPERRRRQAEVVARVIPHIADVRRVGAAALDLCWVACGRLDAYWEVGLQTWDHAAGGLIAAEAGATCGDLSGGPLSTAFSMAAPPTIAGPFRDLLAGAGAAAV